MGIRFYCPNGHKLNVKNFQAGRKGICPFCGARIQIPNRSTRPRSKGIVFPKGADAEGDVDEAMESAMAEFLESGSKPGPQAAVGAAAGSKAAGVGGQQQTKMDRPSEGPVPVVPGASRPAAPQPRSVQPSGGPQDGEKPGVAEPAASGAGGPAPAPNVEALRAEGGQPESEAVAGGVPATGPAPSAPPLPGVPDPIAEAPDMIWYVRPPTGGQFGPAAGQLMRNWLAEGRVSSETLVWREGWREWQEAGKVFPQLLGDGAAAGGQALPGSAGTPLDFSVSHAHAQHAHHRRIRHHFNGDQFTRVAALAVAVVILVAVFLYVLFWQK